MTAAEDNNPVLSPLRPDLEFYPGPPEPDGSPTYSLHDPLTGQYHRIGWAESMVLRLLNRPIRLRQLVEILVRTTPLPYTEKDVTSLYMQAMQSGLTISSGVADVNHLLRLNAAKKVHPVKWLMMHYLYFRIPLIFPAAFLQRTLPKVRWLASRSARLLYLILTLIGIYFVIQSPTVYFSTFLPFFSWKGIAAYSLTVACLKLIHEFSHAYTATALGVRVRSMGLAFMVFWPIPFCDVTDAWKLHNRRQRAYIGLAGISVELVIAGVSLFMWGILEPSLARSIFFITSSASLISTLMVNLNPAMRFDGYYILTDIWGIDNLQARAFAMTRWALHRFFLGLDEPAPESGVPWKRLMGMMLYSIYTWIYRVGLYVGIAILVYYRFTKALGILLFSTEIIMFLIFPIVREVKYLMARKNIFTLNPRLVASLTVLALVLIWLGVPMPRRVSLPAVTVPLASQTLYAPEGGKITNLNTERNATVKVGQPLLYIVSQQRQARIDILKLESKSIQQEIKTLAADPMGRRELLSRKEELERVEAELREIQEVEKFNRLHAQVDGVVSSWDNSLRNGRYVYQNMIMGQIESTDKVKLIAFVTESDLRHIKNATDGIFIRGDMPKKYHVSITLINPVREDNLRYYNLSSLAGGEMAVEQTGMGELKLRQSYYRIEANLPESAHAPRLGQSGRLWVKTSPRSILADMARNVARILLRESSF